jgi:hypothetical protein
MKLFLFIVVYEFLYVFLLLVSTKSLVCFVFILILDVLTSFHRILMIAKSSILSLQLKDTLLLPGHICYYPSPDILKGILYVFAVLILTRGRNCWFHEKCNQIEAIKTNSFSLFFFVKVKKKKIFKSGNNRFLFVRQ